MAHEFLTDEWFDAVLEIQEEVPPPRIDFTLNLVVTGGPNGDVDLHSDKGKFARGHAADAPTKLVVPYDVARAMFVDGDQQAGTQAFMAGKIRVEGDMTKLMTMQQGGDQDFTAFQQRLKEVTI